MRPRTHLAAESFWYPIPSWDRAQRLRPMRFCRLIFFRAAACIRITNALSCAGRYHLDVGTLIAPTVVLQGLLGIGPSPAAAISNAISFNLAGTIQLSSSTQSLAAMVLSRISVIDFDSGNCKLTFANSSGIAWTNGLTLTVSNWNGSAVGGGSDQLLFGNTGNGLTPAQLQEIRFVNPSGFPAGTLFAKILPTGEIVPTIVPPLFRVRWWGPIWSFSGREHLFFKRRRIYLALTWMSRHRVLTPTTQRNFRADSFVSGSEVARDF